MILAAAALAVQAGCVGGDLGESGKVRTCKVRVSMDVANQAYPTYTRATNETAVNQLHVAAFDSAGKFFNGYTAAPVAGQPNVFEVDLPIGRYDLAFWANVDRATFNSLRQGESTWDAMSGLVINVVPNSLGAIPMTGFLRGTTIDQTTQLTGAKAIKLLRMFGRIDLKLAADVTNSGITLKGGLRLGNFNENGVIFPNYGANSWNDSYNGYATLPPSPATRYGIGNVYGAESGGAITNIYTYEKYNDEADLVKKLCVVFGISRNGGALEWFRVDFVVMSNGQKVYLNMLRNHLYEINITRITGTGYSTPEDAYYAAMSHVEANVVVWTDSGMNEVNVDGQYYVMVNRKEINMEPYGLAYYTIDIETNLPNFLMKKNDTGEEMRPGSPDLLYTNDGSHIGSNIRSASEPNHYTLTVRSERPNIRYQSYAFTHNWTLSVGRIRIPIKITMRGEEPTTYLLYVDGEGRLKVGQWGAVTADNLVYTKFGSVVGLKATDAHDNAVVFDPREGSHSNKYEDIPYMNDQVAEERYVSKRHTNANLAKGLGDICRLVGLTATEARAAIAAGTLEGYDSGFRLPTRLETEVTYWDSGKFVNAEINGQNGRWFSGVKDFLPKTGYFNIYFNAPDGTPPIFANRNHTYHQHNDETYLYNGTELHNYASWCDANKYNIAQGLSIVNNASLNRCHPTRKPN